MRANGLSVAGVRIPAHPGRRQQSIFLERTHQRLFVDYRTAGRVDEAGRGFHAPQKCLVDQVVGLGIQQGVDRHIVGPGREGVQRHRSTPNAAKRASST